MLVYTVCMVKYIKIEEKATVFLGLSAFDSKYYFMEHYKHFYGLFIFVRRGIIILRKLFLYIKTASYCRRRYVFVFELFYEFLMF